MFNKALILRVRGSLSQVKNMIEKLKFSMCEIEYVFT